MPVSNTVTRRRVELSDGQIIIRRIVVETGDNTQVRDAVTASQAVMHDQPARDMHTSHDRRGIINRFRKRR